VHDLGFIFGYELDYTSFVYTYESLETPIPVILSEEIMMVNESGDILSIVCRLHCNPELWEEVTVVLTGMYHNTINSANYTASSFCLGVCTRRYYWFYNITIFG